MKHPAHNYSLYINLQQLGEVGSCNIQLLYIYKNVFAYKYYNMLLIPQNQHFDFT